MFPSLKKILKNSLSESVKDKLKIISRIINPIGFKIKIKQVQWNQRKALQGIKSKDKIKVVFFLIHDADWKYEGVYRLMEKDNRFEPLVIVCPFISYGEDFMLRVMNQAYETFKKNGYQVIKSQNEKSGEWLNVKDVIQPDIVCFTSPWNLTRPEYLISNFLDILSCYVPYGYETSHLYDAYYNRPMQNLVWKFFLENEVHKSLSLQYSSNRAKNTVVTGYPGMDKFLLRDDRPYDVWKIKDKKIKRIIWAAHHTIPGMGASLDYSTFLNYSEVMIQIAMKFKDEIQIAFKPHPMLKENLSKPDVWGKEKTAEYYRKWSQLSNGQLEEGDYIDLFFTSDAMIHDCGSFVIEYLYTKKPVLYLYRDDSITDRFNEIGKMALSKFYPGRSSSDINQFVSDVVISKHDPMMEDRIQFFNSVIKPPNGLTASENIFNDLKSEIFN